MDFSDQHTKEGGGTGEERAETTRGTSHCTTLDHNGDTSRWYSSMSPPLTIAFLVAVLGSLFPGDEKKMGAVDKSLAKDNRSFFSLGVALGLGLGWAITRRRYLERLRSAVRSCFVAFNDGKGLADLKDAPTNIQDCQSSSMGHDQCCVRTLVCPNTATTSTLHCSALSLAPGCRMICRRSKGVELYHVVHGVATLNKRSHPKSEADVVEITKGQVMVVEPWCWRWIENRGRGELLVVRSTDGGFDYSKEGFDAVGLEDARSLHASQLIKSGVEYLRSVARTYGNADGSSCTEIAS